jgi:hypothetical protein
MKNSFTISRQIHPSSVLIGFILTCFFFSCKGRLSDKEIFKLLKSEDPGSLVEGAYFAGETGDKKFTELLLVNANDPRVCTNLKFKGFSVYQEKMIALRKIYQAPPPRPITRQPDSIIIMFYLKITKSHR